MKKLINFKNLGELIHAYANANCEGNFSLAVRVLIKKGLSSGDRAEAASKEDQLDMLK